MPGQSMISYINQLGRPVFTTHELTALSGKSQSNVTQALNFLESQGLILRVYRGIWTEAGRERLSPYSIIPYLFPRRRAYVSFISALHLYGIIEQIPREITLASTGHTKIIRTRVGVFSVHRISPLFFDGFDWYREKGSFLIAEPEKALVDSLYLSACKGKQFGYFPELHFPESFSLKKAKAWAEKIPNPKISSHVKRKLSAL